MTAIADANILILFSRAGIFHLIPALFDQVLTTPDVYDTVTLTHPIG